LCKEVALEFSSYVSVELFVEMWRLATAEPHSFFLCDFEAPAAIRFRKNWDLAFKLSEPIIKNATKTDDTGAAALMAPAAAH
jgi:hypothetical protein